MNGFIFQTLRDETQLIVLQGASASTEVKVPFDVSNHSARFIIAEYYKGKELLVLELGSGINFESTSESESVISIEATAEQTLKLDDNLLGKYEFTLTSEIGETVRVVWGPVKVWPRVARR